MISGAAISMFGYLSSDTLNMPRVLFRSAKDKVIPIKALSLVHSNYATPYIAVIVYTSLGCFFAITGEFKQLAILSSSSVLLVYLGVAFAVMKLRSKTFETSNSFKISGGFTIPILSILTILWLLSNLTRQEMEGIIIALGILSFLFLVIKYFKLDKQNY
jgi:amino acid transporter